MENPERTDGNILCGLKTDLNLLLECVKYQMDSPVTQKQALITIYSICQQNGEASDYFREIGGLQFVNGLLKLSDASILREAALFTLGALAESSVYCQQSLCTAELLSDVALSLAQKDASLILKRMAVYVILVLVSHNKIGQALVRTTGCVDVLLNLFRTSFPMSDKKIVHENIGQYYELWSSIGSTLCACVNNPQNEENQRLCITAFPFAKDCLQKCIRQEVIRPICAFIGLTVANNSYVQDYFCKVGGLDALAQALVRLADESVRHHSSTELAVAMTKTLDSCISENSSVASRLSEYLIVPKLVALLSQNGLDISSKLGIILAIGHCTDGCEAHQYQLLQSNGLPLMIQIVAESQDEEQRKAATFVLQSCKLITERLSNSLVENCQPRGDTVTSDGIDYPEDSSLQNYWKFAEGFLHRIETLEKQQEEQMTSNIMNTRVTDAQPTSTEPNSCVNLKFQSCDSLLAETDQLAKQREDVPLKHSSDQHSLDKSCMDNTKMDKRTGGTRQAKIQHSTPVKRKLDFSHAVNGYRKEDSVIPAINSSSSRAEENRSQFRDQRLMKKVRRQIFVEDDVPQESIRENTDTALFGKADDGRLNSVAKARNMNSQQQDLPSGPPGCDGLSDSSDTQNRAGVPETKQQHGARVWSLECRKPTNQPVTVLEAEVPRPSASRKEQKSSEKEDYKKRCATSFDRQDPFKRPAPVRRKRSKQNYIDPLILCSDLIDNEISTTSPAPSVNASLDFRCSGCSTVAASLNSRNFSKILQSCPNKCDRHKVIQDCEDRYKKELKKLLTCYSTITDKNPCLTPRKKERGAVHYPKASYSEVSASCDSTKKFLLTPIKKTASCITNFHRQQTDFITWPKPSTKDVHINNPCLTPRKKERGAVHYPKAAYSEVSASCDSTKKFLLTPIKKTASCITNFHRQQTDFITWHKSSTKDVHINNFLLTPMKKSVSGAPTFPRQRRDDTTSFKPTVGQGHVNNQKYQADHRKDLYTPQACNKITSRDHAYSFDDDEHSDACEYALGMKQKRKRRRRTDFTEQEVCYLLDGVKKMGYHWNSILWSYPFQKGRTNIDLAHKYRNLQLGPHSWSRITHKEEPHLQFIESYQHRELCPFVSAFGRGEDGRKMKENKLSHRTTAAALSQCICPLPQEVFTKNEDEEGERKNKLKGRYILL
uniref:telomere repeats-binding bouquet formation protein 1 isoform X4 n=1 Tax=Pristiophorus japonicus TaxID=55135 RepID=UPI00398ED689